MDSRCVHARNCGLIDSTCSRVVVGARSGSLLIRAEKTKGAALAFNSALKAILRGIQQ